MTEATVKPYVLFVDDEPDVLAGLRQSLRKERNRWRMGFACGGQEALESVERDSPDLIVTDMRMPGMSGAELLTKVAAISPGTIRFVLSGEASASLALKAAAVAHQWLSKPCPRESLVRVIGQALELGQLVRDVTVRAAALGLKQLPPAPSVYRVVIEAMEDPDIRLERVAERIEQDPALAARVLQLTNSSFFGPRQVVTSVQRAVANLGLRLLADVVLASEIFGGTFSSDPAVREVIEEIADHGRRVIGLADRIAHDLGVAADTCRTAALLHDVGRLVLVGAGHRGFEDRSGRSAGERRAQELAALGFTHAQLGATLLHGWGLPIGIVEAVALHDDPERVTARDLDHAAVVFLANAIDHGDPVDAAWATREGFADRIDDWRAFHGKAGGTAA